MVVYNSKVRKAFLAFSYVILILLFTAGLFPFFHVLALSFSSSAHAIGGDVVIWPVGFNMESYKRLLQQPDFAYSVLMTIKRIILGVTINFLLIVLSAYPLSKENRTFKLRTFYAWFFVITILFNGGLIPWYLTIKSYNLLDKVWALVLPGAVPVFSVMLLLNFFRGLPKELEEAAVIDGASHWGILWRIFIPVSKPALATITLFSFVGHWNSWFDGLILMNSVRNYPLQSFMQTFVIRSDTQLFSMKDLEVLKHASELTLKSALIVLGALPIMILFPFLQKFLSKGIVLGSVKQ